MQSWWIQPYLQSRNRRVWQPGTPCRVTRQPRSQIRGVAPYSILAHTPTKVPSQTTRYCDAPLSTFASTYCAKSNSPRSPGKLLSLGDARHACLLSCRLLGSGFGDDTPRAGTRTFKSRGCRGLPLSRLGRAAHGAVGALSAAAKTSTAMVVLRDTH